MVNCEFDWDQAVQVYVALTFRIRALRQLVADNDGDAEVLKELAAAEAALDTFSRASREILARV